MFMVLKVYSYTLHQASNSDASWMRLYNSELFLPGVIILIYSVIFFDDGLNIPVKVYFTIGTLDLNRISLSWYSCTQCLYSQIQCYTKSFYSSDVGAMTFGWCAEYLHQFETCKVMLTEMKGQQLQKLCLILLWFIVAEEGVQRALKCKGYAEV